MSQSFTGKMVNQSSLELVLVNKWLAEPDYDHWNTQPPDSIAPGKDPGSWFECSSSKKWDAHAGHLTYEAREDGRALAQIKVSWHIPGDFNPNPTPLGYDLSREKILNVYQQPPSQHIRRNETRPKVLWTVKEWPD